MGYKYIQTLTKKGYENKHNKRRNRLSKNGNIRQDTLHESVKRLVQTFSQQLIQKSLIYDLMADRIGLRIRLDFFKLRQLHMVYVDKHFSLQLESRQDNKRKIEVLQSVRDEVKRERRTPQGRMRYQQLQRQRTQRLAVRREGQEVNRELNDDELSNSFFDFDLNDDSEISILQQQQLAFHGRVRRERNIIGEDDDEQIVGQYWINELQRITTRRSRQQ